MRIQVDDLVDDLRIFARARSINGRYNTLARPKPLVSAGATGLPHIGLVVIDVDDMEWFSDDFLLDVLIHEIGHVLGFGTLWDRKNLVRGVSDRHFTGPLAIQAFDDAGGSIYDGPKVPVDSDGSHWRKSVFGNEVMTRGIVGGGWLSREPLSTITIQSMADMGYEVDVRRADEYRLPEPAGAKPAAEHVLNWGDCISEGPIYVVDENGRIVDVVGEQDSVD